MRCSRIHIGALLILTAAVCGCAAGQEGDSGRVDLTPTEQIDYANDANLYRAHAAELRDMARRRQIEADVLARKENPDMEKIQGKRELAKDLSDAAEVFDAKARELQRRVPHGMVQ
jgi:hypothetical protein